MPMDVTFAHAQFYTEIYYMDFKSKLPFYVQLVSFISASLVGILISP